ncbi:MAG: deoxyguanosinetriphosphate triphosphohydrolase [Catonella sp.]|uniref:deoxyguanosinetriphosphate triphosphohydrolase n=1 Tax=Catonella sp. TaxID=2382125 RepID=UPI003F9EDBB3
MGKVKCIREIREELEHKMLCEFASFADSSEGRDKKEEPDEIRTIYQRDRDRILHCKSFRRLKHKTQVFLDPEGDHYRTRLTHTLEVAQIARTIARALMLNEDLTEAIALGHDLGHTPFGHAGERALNRISPYGFLHNEQSVRVVELLEKHGEGLNLTKEVRDGIRNHRSACEPYTLEGKIVRLSDKIAYVNHDIDDALRGGILTEEDLPAEFTDIVGHSVAGRIDAMVKDVIFTSFGKNEVKMSEKVEGAMRGLRSFLMREVYSNPAAKSEEVQAQRLVEYLYRHYLENYETLPEEYKKLADEMGEPVERVVCDYIAGMSDDFAIKTIKEIFVPVRWGKY